MVSWFEFIKADAEAHPEMSAQEWLEWKKRKRKLGKPGKASMTKPKNLERQTHGELEEIKKDPHKANNYMDAGGNPQKKKPDEIKDEKWFKEYADNVDFDKVKISDLWKKWLKKKVEDTKSIEGAPCLTCPVEEDCGKPGDKYSPKTCEMLDCSLA